MVAARWTDERMVAARWKDGRMVAAQWKDGMMATVRWKDERMATVRWKDERMVGSLRVYALSKVVTCVTYCFRRETCCFRRDLAERLIRSRTKSCSDR
jgi:hypothetical protein